MVGMRPHVLCAATDSQEPTVSPARVSLAQGLDSHPNPKTEVLVLLGQESELSLTDGHCWLSHEGVEIGCSSDLGNSIYFMGNSVVASF